MDLVALLLDAREPVSWAELKEAFDDDYGQGSDEAAERNRQSIQVSDRIQEEDVGICAAVQRGLHSRSYGAGRLSVRREGGMHLFHRLLAADLRAGLPAGSQHAATG